jgi:hypothetical protein
MDTPTFAQKFHLQITFGLIKKKPNGGVGGLVIAQPYVD